jgi:phosphopantothenoylcysteine decarboxylase/phosphopantothenate--cysteine ligase
MLNGKRILLIVCGGIAAYKALELIRRVRERGATVRAVMTEAAEHFVTPLSVGALTGDKVFRHLFDLTDEAEMGHIELSRDADLVVVAPATANVMAKLANGLADDLASTILLATDKRVLLAPAMNVRMWHHPATQRNLQVLQADGHLLVGPNSGEMACGEYGPGRMAEPMEIVSAMEQAFLGETVVTMPMPGEDVIVPPIPARLAAPDPAAPPAPGPLAGTHIVVTSGPTHEPIDPVRYLANRSSGKQGHAIAAAAAAAGARVTLISGPVRLPDPPGVDMVKVETAREMLHAVEAALPADVFVAAAAVADWRTAGTSDHKIKKVPGSRGPTLALVENPDVLHAVARRRIDRPGLVVGFAAETQDVVANAVAKRQRKGCDWIVANDVSPASGVMGGDRNTVHLVTAAGVEHWPTASKDDVARSLVARVAQALKGE